MEKYFVKLRTFIIVYLKSQSTASKQFEKANVRKRLFYSGKMQNVLKVQQPIKIIA